LLPRDPSSHHPHQIQSPLGGQQSLDVVADEDDPFVLLPATASTLPPAATELASQEPSSGAAAAGDSVEAAAGVRVLGGSSSSTTWSSNCCPPPDLAPDHQQLFKTIVDTDLQAQVRSVDWKGFLIWLHKHFKEKDACGDVINPRVISGGSNQLLCTPQLFTFCAKAKEKLEKWRVAAETLKAIIEAITRTLRAMAEDDTPTGHRVLEGGSFASGCFSILYRWWEVTRQVGAW
jgi:hypothetical protein